ncbi:MAG: winged helix-turn-helix domain-containing protein [Nitrososphaerales archaeon]
MYRTHVRIVADILNTARDCSDESGGVGITVLIRRANVSYGRLRKILGMLVEGGLLQEISEERASRYRISEKGMEFLKVYSNFHDFSESFGLKI